MSGRDLELVLTLALTLVTTGIAVAAVELWHRRKERRDV